MTTKLNLGCGRDLKSDPAWINVDQTVPEGYVTIPKDPVDVATSNLRDLRDLEQAEAAAGATYSFLQVDLDKTPWPWDDNAATHLLASHVLEHLDSVVDFMDEAHRVLDPSGTLEIRVPNWGHPNAHQDPTHQHTFTWGSLDYFLDDRPPDLEPLGNGRWVLLHKERKGSWDHLPSRWRHWARRCHDWIGLPTPRWQEVNWQLTPAGETP